MSESGTDFLRPPVVERAVTVIAPIGEETYVSRFPAWQSKVQLDFPVYEPVTQWLLNAEIKQDLVSADPRKAKLNIIPRFSKKTSKAGFDWSLRSPKDALTMNMHSGAKMRRRYHDLRGAFSQWFSLWIEQFNVEKFQRLNLHYVNLINRDSVPDFAADDGRLFLDRLLTVFVKLPGENKDIVPPLDCTVNLKLRDDPPASLLIHLYGVAAPIQRPTVHLDLVVETLIPVGTAASQVLDLLDWCHLRILDQFQIVFTKEAIQSFGPIVK